MKIHGIDKSLYKFSALKDNKKVATIKVVAYTKFQAYYECVKYFPEQWIHLRTYSICGR